MSLKSQVLLSFSVVSLDTGETSVRMSDLNDEVIELTRIPYFTGALDILSLAKNAIITQLNEMDI